MSLKIRRLAVLSILLAVVSACATTSHEEGGIGGTGYADQQFEE